MPTNGSSIGNRSPLARPASQFPATSTSPGLVIRPVVRSSEPNTPWQLDLEARGGRGIYRKTK